MSDTVDIVDNTGQVMHMSRQKWSETAVIPSLRDARDNPPLLAHLLAEHLRDGFYEECLEPARHLLQTAPLELKVHAAACLAAALRNLRRLPEAEEVLVTAIRDHPGNPILLTGLAVVADVRGQKVRAEDLYWQALVSDPNYGDPLSGLMLIVGEERGDEMLQKAAALPNAWRPLLWLARIDLDAGQVESALEKYKTVLIRAQPPPADVLGQVSGELGQAGLCAQAIDLCAKHFDFKSPDIRPGGNLIRCYLEVGDAPPAREILETFYRLNFPPIRPILTELDILVSKLENRPELDRAKSEQPLMREISMPQWMRDASPLQDIAPSKRKDSPLIGFVCGVVELPPGTETESVDFDLGKLSRGITAFLAEEVFLRTEAKTLIRYLAYPGVVFGLATNRSRTKDFMHRRHGVNHLVVLDLIRKEESWIAEYTVVEADGRKGSCLLDEKDPATTANCLLDELLKDLEGCRIGLNGSISDRLRLPAGPAQSFYVLCLNQALAVKGCRSELPGARSLIAERNVFDNLVRLSWSMPKSLRPRLLLLSALEDEAAVRPDIAKEFLPLVDELNAQRPLEAEAQPALECFIAKITGGG